MPVDSSPSAAWTGPVLFFDRGCGLCGRSVRWLLRHDPRGVLRFAPLQGATFAASAARLGLAPLEPGDAGDSAILIEFPDGGSGSPRVSARSDAVLRATLRVGGAWGIMARIGLLIPRAARDALYDHVARRRDRIAGGAVSCPIHTDTPGPRADRFLP